MKNITIMAVLFTGISLLPGCSPSETTDTENLFPDVTLNNEITEKTKLSDIFDEYRKVQLSTSDSTLISTADIKVVKRDGIFYIKSVNDIYQFDSDGNHLSSLKAVGNGPGEYTRISDFDVVIRAAGTEIWVSDLKNILRYDAKTLSFLGSINEDFYVNQLKYVNDTTILCTTNKGDYFRVIDMEGNMKKEFLDVSFANSCQKQHGFKIHGGYVTYQFSNTDEAMVYGTDNGEYRISSILPKEDYFQTMALGDEFYEKYQMDFNSKLMEYVGIMAYQQEGDYISMTSMWPGKKWKYTVGDIKENAKTYVFYPEADSVIENDIFPGVDPLFLATLTCCDADDCLLFLLEDNSPDENNPAILEVHKLK